MPCFLKPQGPRVVVREDSFHYEGTIVIPDAVQRRGTTGRIIEVGDEVAGGVNGHAPQFQIGDRVLFSTFSGTSIAIRNKEGKTKEELRVLKVEEILAKIVSDDVEIEYTSA